MRWGHLHAGHNRRGLLPMHQVRLPLDVALQRRGPLLVLGLVAAQVQAGHAIGLRRGGDEAVRRLHGGHVSRNRSERDPSVHVRRIVRHDRHAQRTVQREGVRDGNDRAAAGRVGRLPRTHDARVGAVHGRPRGARVRQDRRARVRDVLQALQERQLRLGESVLRDKRGGQRAVLRGLLRQDPDPSPRVRLRADVGTGQGGTQGADQPQLRLLRTGGDTAVVERELPEGVAGAVRIVRHALLAAGTGRHGTQVRVGDGALVLDVQ
mmetsp:Transcript_5497/g.11973  ORF Transcript_5497/g.11973 Transcript_5497/m.11973 type:complete len:265 (-) Transcript_5497:454-1248(-)